MTTEPKSWAEYLRPDDIDELAACCHQACAQTFEQESKRILQVWEQLKPETALCLGAGCLNDIPVRQVLEGGTQLTLVDWVPGMIRAGLEREMVYGPTESPSCVVCQTRDDCPTDLCVNYQPTPHPDKVCANFKPGKEPGCRCANYMAGKKPQVLEEDVTGGIGGKFAESVAPCLNRSPNPGAAVSRLRKTLRSVEKE